MQNESSKLIQDILNLLNVRNDIDSLEVLLCVKIQIVLHTQLSFFCDNDFGRKIVFSH